MEELPADLAELMRRSVEALNSRDVDAFCTLCRPDVEFKGQLAELDGIYLGYAGVRRWWRDMDDLGFVRLESKEVRDLGDGRFLQRGTSYFHAPASGIDIENRWVAIVETREGLIARLSIDPDKGDSGTNVVFTP